MKQQYKFRDLQRVLGKEGLLKASLNDLYTKPGEGADGKFVPAVIETARHGREIPFTQALCIRSLHGPVPGGRAVGSLPDAVPDTDTTTVR